MLFGVLKAHSIDDFWCSQVPVLHDVRDITLARNGLVALVSYEHKVCLRVCCIIRGRAVLIKGKAPPQLWQIVMVKDGNHESNHESHSSARLSLSHTYMPKSPVDFAGPSYFGGKDDQLVLCAGKGNRQHPF